MRQALVRGDMTREQLERYLPANYRVAGPADPDPKYGIPGWLIEGDDESGWTLDRYVIPRLASGMIWAEEIK